MLQQTFIEITARSTVDTQLVSSYWQEIAFHYQQTGRHYHNLDHIGDLLAELQQCSQLLQDQDALRYAAFYHDIIYDVSRNDNEEQSALIAVARLQALHVNEETTERCRQHILATQSHRQENSEDTNLLTDADLAILGKAPQRYRAYSLAIRAEYSAYPDDLYLPGRAKVLKHFLDMPYIYKTAYFRDLYEKQARTNIHDELATLR